MRRLIHDAILPTDVLWKLRDARSAFTPKVLRFQPSEAREGTVAGAGYTPSPERFVARHRNHLPRSRNRRSHPGQRPTLVYVPGGVHADPAHRRHPVGGVANQKAGPERNTVATAAAKYSRCRPARPSPPAPRSRPTPASNRPTEGCSIRNDVSRPKPHDSQGHMITQFRT